jgi:FMN phosphatase YigB (HAD superfamily)
MPKSLANLRAIVFDEDNTLLDYSAMKIASIHAAADAMVEAGLGLTVEEATERINGVYKKRGAEYQKVFDYLLKSLDMDANQRIFNKIKFLGIAAYKRAKQMHLKPYPDIPLVLEKLNLMKYDLALISDAPPEQAWSRLCETDLAKYFRIDYIYMGMGKKASGAPFWALMGEHHYKPQELMMIGDNPKADIKPANELGIITAIVKYGQVFPISKRDKMQTPDYWLFSLWDLIPLLENAK